MYNLNKKIAELEKETIFLKKAATFFAKGIRLEIYQFIDRNKDMFGLRWLFRHFNVAPNAYYNYLKDNKSGSLKDKWRICEEIKNIYCNNNKLLGNRGMKIFLERKGVYLSKTTVHKYMNRELNLYAATM